MKNYILNKFSGYILILFILIAGISCSVKKNTVISRQYHRTTAHYNGYFNAREKIKQGAKTLAASQVDRFDRILPVFKYGDETLAKAVFPDMDEAIKKVSTVIQRHSMDIDGKERNKWIDDSYLLIGIAQFYKHDTWTAIESFQFVASQFRTEPIRYDALLWLTQCYLRLGKMPDAEYLLSTFRDDAGFPQKLKPFYNAIYADYYMQLNEYKKAAEHLEKAASMSKKRADRIRYLFILGQIYQKTENYEKAVAKYERVMKLNPPYEMAFNAKVNRARSVDVNSPDAKGIREMLVKMLADEKNKEYLDQIYYALAEISLKENNTEEAITFLKLSTANSVSNTNQKALSYLKLAEIYFKKPEYKQSQAFYDSTVAFLSEDHPDYFTIINTKNNLTKLIRNLNIIQTEDSLARLAGLSVAERESIIDAHINRENDEKERIKKEKEEQEKLLEEGKLDEEGDPGFRPPQDFKPTQGQAAGGAWYFTNPSAISFGYTEFIKKWGNRKLEDNWRRSQKTTFSEAQAGLEESTETTDSTEVLEQELNDSILALDNAKRRQVYLDAVPDSPEEKQKSDDRIIEAYYNVGLIYKEQLKDNKESAKNFETLLQRFPENQYKLATYYNLYRVYLALEDEEKANYYKNIILNDYPDTEYAKIILNPDYYKDMQKKVAIQKVFYENTYRAYLNKQYEDVIERASMADTMFKSSELAPKYELLKSMAIGKIRSLPEFEASLKNVVTKFPEDTVAVRAKEILALLNPATFRAPDTTSQNGNAPPLNKISEAPVNVVNYIYKPDTVQYVMFTFLNNVISANDLKVAVSDFNSKFHRLKKLQISNSFIGSENQFVMIREFRNKDEAHSYLNGLLTDAEAFGDIDITLTIPLTISPDNMILLMQSKDIEGYEQFFDANYRN